MNRVSKSSKAKARAGAPASQQSRYFWVGAGIAVLVLAAAVVLVYWISLPPFKLVAGPDQLVVLLRNTKAAEYELRYTGRGPVKISRMLPMLEGQILNVAVVEVHVVVGETSVQVDPDGNLPAGQELTVNPDQVIMVRVVYHGDKIGWNYLYGFRIVYTAGQRTKSVDFKLNPKLSIFVE